MTSHVYLSPQKISAKLYISKLCRLEEHPMCQSLTSSKFLVLRASRQQRRERVVIYTKVARKALSIFLVLYCLIALLAAFHLTFGALRSYVLVSCVYRKTRVVFITQPPVYIHFTCLKSSTVESQFIALRSGSYISVWSYLLCQFSCSTINVLTISLRIFSESFLSSFQS